MILVVAAAALFSALFAQADLITPNSVIASSDGNGRDPDNLYNGVEMVLKSGGVANNWADWEMNASDHKFSNGEGWAADQTSGNAAWVIIDLGANHIVSTMSIWNFNPSAGDYKGRSAKDLNIYYTSDRSGDGNSDDSKAAFSTTGWTSYSSDLVLSQNAGGSTVTSPNGVLTNMNITARYIAIEAESVYRTQDFGKVTMQEVQVFGTIPDRAYNPIPANGSTGVDPDTLLAWSGIPEANEYDVYLGTSATAFESANHSSAEFMGTFSGLSYDPGGLNYGTTYYWTVDAVNGADVWAGDVWSFTTGTLPPPASNPSPAHSASDVALEQDLGWDAVAGADSYDVYFGTSSKNLIFQGNQTGTTFDPGTMGYVITSYWRIDSKNSMGAATGDVWSFTTGTLPPLASNPSPTHSATGVAIEQDLGWDAVAGADSYDVYFGPSDTNLVFQGNQTGTTFDTGTMDANTVYFWRIDPKNAGGTSTGDVWSFTTPTDSKPTWIGCWIMAWRALGGGEPTEWVEVRTNERWGVLYDLRGSGTCDWGNPQWNVPGERGVILDHIKAAGLNLVLYDWTNGIKDTGVPIAIDAASRGMKVASVLRGYGGDWDSNKPPLDEIEGLARANWNKIVRHPDVTNYLEYKGKPLAIIHARPIGVEYIKEQMANATPSEIEYLSKYTLSFSHGFASATRSTANAPFGFRHFGGTKDIRYVSPSDENRTKLNASEFERRCSWAANAEDIVIIGAYDAHGDSQNWGIADTSNAINKDGSPHNDTKYKPVDNFSVYYDVVQGIFATDSGDTAAPAAPAGLTATSSGGRQITLDWADNTEDDLYGYNIYHSETSGGPYSLAAFDQTDSHYIDIGLAPDKTYYYVVTATDVNGRESVYSGEYSSATQSESSYDSGTLEVWRHKPADNVLAQTTSDGTSGSTLDAVEYESDNRYAWGQSFTVSNDCKVDKISVQFTGENDLLDRVEKDTQIKLVLVEYDEATFDAVRWGTFTDPFAGQDSQVIYTSIHNWNTHAGNTQWLVFDLPTNQNLTKDSQYAFALWISNPDSAGGGNKGGTLTLYSSGTYADGKKLRIQGDTGNSVQSVDLNFVVTAPDTTAPAAPRALTGWPGDGQIYLNWSGSPEGDLHSYSLYRSSTSGGPYALVESGLTNSIYLDTGLTNGVTYNYVLTAKDTVGNVSGYSAEFSAIPKSDGDAGTVTVSASNPSSNVVAQHTAGTSLLTLDAEESVDNDRYAWGQSFTVSNDCTVDKISVQYRKRSSLLDLVENDTQINLILLEYDEYTYERDRWGSFTDPMAGQVSHDFYTAVLDWNTGASDGDWLVFDLPTNQSLAKDRQYAFALWISNPDSAGGGTEGGSLTLYQGGSYAGSKLRVQGSTGNAVRDGVLNFVIQEAIPNLAPTFGRTASTKRRQ
jgi:hypothetical protein